MNSVEKISRLQVLLKRVQKRAQEPHVPVQAAAPLPLAPPEVPLVTAVELEVKSAARSAVFTPAASPVTTETTLPFAARVEPELIARSGMKSPIGSEPPAGRTEPAPARESGPPEIEMGEAEESISESPKVIPLTALPDDLDFTDLESPEPSEAVESAGPEEVPPASSKRPSLIARLQEPEQEQERPVTAPPESGPQELSVAELGAKGEPLEVDLALKQVPVPREATIEQLGNTVELEAATEEALELAPKAAPPPPRKPEPAGDEMEMDIPASVPPGVFRPDLPPVHVEPAEQAASAEPLAAAEAAPLAEARRQETGLEPVEELAPASEKAPAPAVDLPKPEAAPAAEARVEEPAPEPITAVRLIVPAPKAEAVPVTIDVRPVAAAGAVLEAEAAAFVGAARSFEPGSFLDLLDASLALANRS